MCDYCGCRTQPAIAQLADEHERIDALADELAHAAHQRDRVAVTKAAAALTATLRPHTQQEEQLLVELARAGVTDPVTALRADHRELDTVFAAAAHGDDVDEPLLSDAVQQLHDHILREEHDVFPAALQLLDAAAWERINATVPTE